MTSRFRDGARMGASQPTSSIDLLDVDAACRALRVSRGTIYKMLRTGNLRAVKIFSRTFFRREDLADLIDRSVTPELGRSVQHNGGCDDGLTG
jgi:excisionase family DNA binding protein